MTSPPATGSFEIHSAVNITWLRLSGSNLHCFALREIDETIFKKLQRTQSDLEDAANDPQYLAQKLGDSTNVSLRHACSCLNIPLYPATHEEIVELKRAEAIGCRAPCASLILGSHLVHVLQAFGRRHFSRVIRAQLESLGDASLDPQHNGTIPGRNASDHPKKKKSDEDLPPRKASAAAAKRSNANATAAANAAAAAAANANANNPPIAIASNPYGTTSRRGQSNPAAGVNQSALDQLQIIPPSQSTSQNNMKNKDPNSTLGYYDDSVPGPKNKKSRHSNTQSVSYYDQNGNYQIDPYVLNQMDAANQFVQLQQTHPGSFPHNQLLYSHQLSSQPNQHSQSYNDPNPHLSHSHTPGSTINSIQTQGHPGLFPPNSQLRVSLHDDHHDDHNHHISQHLNPHSNLLHQANVLLPSSSTALAPSLTNHHSVPGLFPHRPQSAVASARDNAITQQLLTTPSNKTPSLNNDRSNAFGTNSDHQPHNTNLSHALGQLQHHYNANSLLHQPQHHHQPAFTLKDSFHVTPGKNQSQHTRPISAAPFSSHPGATSQSIHNNNNLPQSATNQHNQSTSSITSSQSLSSSSNLNTSNNINTNTNTTNTNQHLTTTLQQTFSALPHQLHTIHSSHPSHDGQTSAYQNNSLPTLQRAPTGPLALIRNNSNISSTNMPASLIATTIASNPLHHQPSSKDLSHATIPSIASIANLPVQSLTNQANQSTGTAGAANLGSIANMPGFGNPLNRNQYTTVLQHTNSIGFMTNHPQSNLDSLITSLPSTSSALTIAGRPFSGNAMQSYQPFGVTRPTSAFYPQNQHQQPFQLAQQPFQITADIVGFSVQKKGPIPTISFMVADDGPAPTPVTSNSLPTSSDDHNVSPANEPLPNASATEDDNDGSEIQELVTTQPIPQVTE